MTEAKMSYLHGFDAQNDFRARGLFPGSPTAGFAVSALFRDRAPSSNLGGQAMLNKCVMGNLLDRGGGSFAGWNVVMQTTNNGASQAGVLFNYANGSGNVATMIAILFASPSAMRTLLFQIFFGFTTVVGKGNNDTAIIAVNGTVMAVVTGLNGYTQAPGDADFIVGNSADTADYDPATTIGLAGLSYQSQVCDDPRSIDSYAQVVNIIADQWEAVNADEDMRDGDLPIITDMFSVRRGLPELPDGDTWTATKGSAVLTRRGTSALSVESCKPRYYGGLVEAGLD